MSKIDIQNLRDSYSQFPDLEFSRDVLKLCDAYDEQAKEIEALKEKFKMEEEICFSFSAQIDYLKQYSKQLEEKLKVDEQAKEIEHLKGAIKAQDEREKIAGEQCGVLWAWHNCDWPEWVADKILEQKKEIAALKDKLKVAEDMLNRIAKIDGGWLTAEFMHGVAIEALKKIRGEG